MACENQVLQRQAPRVPKTRPTSCENLAHHAIQLGRCAEQVHVVSEAGFELQVVRLEIRPIQERNDEHDRAVRGVHEFAQLEWFRW